MDKELKELMQITIKSENELLNNLITDIEPCIINKIQDVSNVSNQEFRIVVYKKQNIITRLFKDIKFLFKKIKILRNTTELDLAKNKTLNNK